MFAYGQEEVEVVFAFVKRRCFFCHRDVASGCETAIVRLSGDCRRSFGNRRNDTFIYGGYTFIRAAPCHRRDCGVRRDYGSRQRASRSFFQFQCLRTDRDTGHRDYFHFVVVIASRERKGSQGYHERKQCKFDFFHFSLFLVIQILIITYYPVSNRLQRMYTWRNDVSIQG